MEFHTNQRENLKCRINAFNKNMTWLYQINFIYRKLVDNILWKGYDLWQSATYLLICPSQPQSFPKLDYHMILLLRYCYCNDQSNIIPIHILRSLIFIRLSNQTFVSLVLIRNYSITLLDSSLQQKSYLLLYYQVHYYHYFLFF